jgi:hypothetical protein
MKKEIVLLAAFVVGGCGNPGGISDAEYASFKELAAPKILYSCTHKRDEFKAKLACYEASLSAGNAFDKCVAKYHDDNPPEVDVAYIAGTGIASNYNKILIKAKGDCSGELKILEGKS